MRTEDFIFPGAELLMPLETPLLRVSRPVAACQRCRQAKIKCDGKLPACSACERANRAAECSSTNDEFAKGKERSYVATLEARVERLERKCGEARSRRKSSLAMLDAAISPRRLSVDDENKPKNVRAARRKELSDIDELVSDFGFLTVNATSRDFYGFTSTISYSKLILASSTRDPLPSGMKKELPPRYAAQALTQHFLNTIYLILPIIEETNFYASIDAVYSPDPLKALVRDQWVVRMVLAISSAMKSRQRGDTYYMDGVGHVCSALDVAEQVLHPGSVWSIQALLLLVIYAMVDPAHFDSWTLIGAASRMMIDLGMHQDPSKSVNMLKSKLELRRRVFWCVYALDRSTSIVQTRAFSFSDDGSNVAFPFSSKPMSPPVSPQGRNMWAQLNESALEFFKLRQMQSSWYTEIFQSGRQALQDPYTLIWQKYRQMSDWFNRLSAHTLPAIRDFFELELLYSYVYILSPNVRCPQISDHAGRLVFEHCTAYAEKMVFITSTPSEMKNPMSFYDALRVYMTAHHFVEVLSKNPDTLLRPHAASPTASFNVSSLDAEVDPLAAAAPGAAPPIPMPAVDTPGGLPRDLTSRAIDTINNFISILSYFGARFGTVGSISWRDRFQQESQTLYNQLHQRRQRQNQFDQGYSMFNGGGPVTPPTQRLSPSPGPAGSFYPSPASTHYSPASGYVQMNPSAVSEAWENAADLGNTNFMTVSSAPDMSGGLMAPMGMDNLGIGNYAAWETLPGGSLNPHFAL